MEAQLVTYPVILHPDNGEYNVEIPDINDDTWIRGTSAASALVRAREVIGKSLANRTELPRATPSDQLQLSEHDILHMIDVDLASFQY